MMKNLLAIKIVFLFLKNKFNVLKFAQNVNLESHDYHNA